MKVRNLTDLFIHELNNMHNAEQQLFKALPGMIARARDKSLKAIFEEHLAETERHASRILEVMDILGLTPKSERVCAAMQGLIEEGRTILSDVADNRAVDAALIAAAQKIEHYEIAAYGTLIAIARTLGYDNAVIILKETLDEEKHADEMLTHFAVDEGVNQQARKAA
jgi:ferritin-like metal-binding protein YciE